MPFKSQAQRAKFGELVKQGKMSQATFDEWQKATGSAKLPERVSPGTPGKPTHAKKIKSPLRRRHKY